MRAGLSALFLVLISVAAGAAGPKPEVKWVDSTKDVYVNGEIDRGAQVMISEATRRMALISPRLDEAIVLDMSAPAFGAVPKSSFRFSADRGSAVTDEFAAVPAGVYSQADESNYSFVVGEKPVLITKHKGLTGEMDESKLWEHVPVWRSLMENYEPQATAVAAIKSAGGPATVTIILATWCPDSKLNVPRLLKALALAANPELRVRLLGIANKVNDKLSEPAEIIHKYSISRVPTVIVERDGKEVGRIVESPKAKTVEEDLASILGGKPGGAKAP